MLKDNGNSSTFLECSKQGTGEDLSYTACSETGCHQNVIAAIAFQFSTIVPFLLSIVQLSNKNNVSDRFLGTVSNVVFSHHLRLKLNVYGVEIL